MSSACVCQLKNDVCLYCKYKLIALKGEEADGKHAKRIKQMEKGHRI